MPDPSRERTWAPELRKRLIALAGVVGIVAIAVVLLSSAGVLGNQGGGEGIEAVTLLDPPEVGATALAVGPERGKLAPDFEVSALDGTRHRLSDFRGKAVLVNFWASWCVFCTAEMPDLQQADLNRGEDLVILSVNRREPVGTAREYLEGVTRMDGGVGVSFDVNALDPDDTLYREYRALGMPATFFIDPDGVIKHIANGPVFLEQLEDALLDTLPSGGD